LIFRGSPATAWLSPQSCGAFIPQQQQGASSMKKHTLAALAVLSLAALPVSAQYGQVPQHWYIGAGIGGGNLNVSGTDLTGLTNATVDDTDTTYTVRLGWRFHPYMALELGYYDLGTYQFHGQGVGAIDGSAKAKSVGLSFVGILPLDALDLYGRIGYARSELKVNASTNVIATPFNEKDHQNEFTYGVGARWNIGRNWGIFGEWMKNDKIEVDSYLIGIDFKF
jgi:OOP family OmpA-OmpF porin